MFSKKLLGRFLQFIKVINCYSKKEIFISLKLNKAYLIYCDEKIEVVQKIEIEYDEKTLCFGFEYNVVSDIIGKNGKEIKIILDSSKNRLEVGTKNVFFRTRKAFIKNNPISILKGKKISSVFLEKKTIKKIKERILNFKTSNKENENFINICFKKGKVLVFIYDQYRLLYCSSLSKLSNTEFGISIPNSVLDSLLKLLQYSSKEVIKIDIYRDYIRVFVNEAIINIKDYGQININYKSILKKSKKYSSVILKKEALYDFLKIVKIVSKRKEDSISITIENKRVILKYKNNTGEDVVSYIETNCSVTKHTNIVLNYKSLLDFVKLVKGDFIYLIYKNSNSKIFMHPSDEFFLIYCLMPLVT
ncbi:hypothetical protein ACWNYH_00600 [Candidatus Vidania fulgoroideorum]